MNSNELLDFESRRLYDRVLAISARARFFAMMIGCSKTVIAVLLGILFLGWLDYQSRWSAPVVRWIATGTLVSIGLLAAYKFLLPSLRRRFSSVDTARLVEIKFELPRGWLSSVIEFMERADLRYGGSDELYRDAVRHGVSQFASVPLEQILSPRKVYQAGLLALAVSGIAVAICAAFPEITNTVMRRLLAPWSDAAWPRTCHLEFMALPSIVPKNAPLELVVINRLGRVPGDVQFEWQFEGQSSPEQSPAQIIDDRAYSRISAVSDTILVRATSHLDSEMPWQRVVVAGLPKLVDFEFELEPPSYTGLETNTVTGWSIRVLKQTKYRLRGRFDLPVRTVAVEEIEASKPIETSASSEQALPDYAKQFVGTSPSGTSPSAVVEAPKSSETPTPLDFGWKFECSEDGKEWLLEHQSGSPLVAERSLRFRIRWESIEGLIDRTANRFDIEVTPDLPPNAEWSPDHQWNSMLADGEISIQGRAVDDLKIAGTELNYELLDSVGNVLKERRMDCRQLAALGVEFDGLPITQVRDSEMIIHGSIRLEKLESGQTLSLWLSAVDSAGQRGESERRLIAIKTEKEWMAEIAAEQTEVLRSLSQAQVKLRHTQSTLNQTLEEIATSDRIEESTRRAIDNAGMQQDAIQQKLEMSADSAGGRVQALLRRLATNERMDSNLANQLTETARRIEQVAELTRPLPDRLHDAAEQAAQDGATAEVRSELAAIVEIQNQADEMISKELSRLGFQESFRDLQRQLLGIAEQQSILREQTAKLEESTSPRSRVAEVEKERNRLASGQRELARQLDQFSASLARAAESIQNVDSTDTERDAMERMRQQLSENGAATRMREAAELLAQQRIAQSQSVQKEVEETLQSIADPKRAATETKADELGHLLATIHRLLPRQKELIAAMEEVGQEPPGLQSFDRAHWADEQSAIRKELENTAPKSDVNEVFRFATKRATDAMARAATSLERLHDWKVAKYHSKIAGERLQAILDALESNRSLPAVSQADRADPKSNSANNDAEKQDSENSSANLPMLQGLELLRSLQVSIRDRLQGLQREIGEETPTAAEWLEWTDLTAEQESIAEQWMKLLQQASEQGEGNG